jgi:hypothetical protein
MRYTKTMDILTALMNFGPDGFKDFIKALNA